MSNKSCASTCSSAASCNKEIHKGDIIWILAGDAGRIHFFVQKPGKEVVPFSIGCCCARHAGNPDNMAQFMEAALACGQYDGLVLVGTSDTLQRLKNTLSSTVQCRIIAKIPHDLTGTPPEALPGIIRECSLF